MAKLNIFNRATVEQLLAGTHPQDFQQLQQELLQQQTSDQELNFALQENQFQSSQPMDLLMSDEHHQSQQITNMPTRNDDGSGNQNAMAHPMQSEMDQMLDIDFMHQVFNSLGSERTGENLDDLALFNDINDVMNIGEWLIYMHFFHFKSFFPLCFILMHIFIM